MINKKVLIINPFGTVYGSGILKPTIPLGLLYLVSFLKKRDVKVSFYDALAEDSSRMIIKGSGKRFGASQKKIEKVIRSINPDVVGIGTMFTAYFEDSIKLAKIVKNVNKKIVVVFGGSHVSVDPIAVLKESKDVDIAVYGEGEETLLEICKGKDLNKIDGIAYRNRNKIIKNKARELIKNLDDIPFPAWEVIDIKKYSLESSFNMRKPVLPMVTSRGCPGHCLYCSVNSVWQHRWRGRSVENILAEIVLLQKNYGAKEFAFQDDSLSVDKIRFERLCDEIIKRKLNIKWTTPNGIAHWTLDKNLIKKMKQAGCYRITFGIESGDCVLRKWVGKPYSLDQAKDLIKYANNIGMWTLSTNIIGFPYETRKQIEKTLKFSIDSGVDLALFFRLGPRPGTPIYEIFKKEGWLMKDRHLLFSEDVACRTKYFLGEEIIKWQKVMYRKFLVKRWLNLSAIFRVVKKIRDMEDFLYVTKFAKVGLRLGLGLISVNSGVTSKTLRASDNKKFI